MTHENIRSLVVVQRRIPVTNLSDEISADLREFLAKNDAQITLKPFHRGQELVDPVEVVPFNETRIVHQIQQVRPGILDSCNRSKPEVLIDEALNNGVVLAESNMHLHGSLTVPDVVHLLTGYLVYMGEDCRQIEVCHMLEAEVPELLVFVRVILGVVPRVFVAPAVAQPHVIAPIGQHKPWRLSLLIEQPGVRTVSKPMHEHNRLETVPDTGPFPLNPEHSKNVSVLGGHLMPLERVAKVLAVSRDVHAGLWVSQYLEANRECQEGQTAEDPHKICSMQYHLQDFYWVEYKVIARQGQRDHQNPSLLLRRDLSTQSLM